MKQLLVVLKAHQEYKLDQIKKEKKEEKEKIKK